MKKVFVLLLLMITIALDINAEKALPKSVTFSKITAFVTVTTAPPGSNLMYTALRESPAFRKEFISIISLIAHDVYDANWNTGSQNPNTTEGRRIAFCNLVLKQDEKTINKIMSYLIQTGYTYTLNDDVQFRIEIRDNFSNTFDILAQAY